MSAINMHDEWLSLIEISGPFLAVPVLKEVFPQGLEELDGLKRKRLRQTYEEWREALDTDDLQFHEIHVAWINEVLSNGLEFDEGGAGDTLKQGNQVATSLRVTLPEHNVTLTPDFTVVDSSQNDKPLMLIHMYAANIDLEAAINQDGWAASPAERMVQLCRMTGCRIGLITNGERWMLVDAPVGAVTSFASWYARIWSQEPITLQAFVHLLGIRRFFFDELEQLPALFDRSLKFQDEVTEALGEQVRRAVEVLIQSLDKADQDRNRELLREVAPTELYEAGLTVMMRLVFLLSAEERGLLLMGDERYEANYALSTLRMQLRSESEEILERRWDAWSRLLAIFRAVFGGIEHENLRMPALGGSLFDPDRFPFIEGRGKGSQWHTDAAKPLPIDNRTVLLLLEAIQQYQGRTLSYRALDVEQIGYVYEGLLERTVKRTDEVTLELDATKNAKTPWVRLGELESAKLDGADQLVALFIERLGSSASRVFNDLARPVDDVLSDRLLAACQGSLDLRDRIKQYAHLLRIDSWGYPLVYPKGAFIVTSGSDRRETGAHYTPKSLTESIVVETLTPIVYFGPAEGKPIMDWRLKSPAELLNLKICDPAMGSGAFLVQACRWLSDRLVEAWGQAEDFGQFIDVDGIVSASLGKAEALPRDAEARTVIARLLIAERCLYGVDLNPLAVELAKLSIWLVTLAKGRPFGFLDHNLRCGDSLIGIHRLDQLTELRMKPDDKGQQRLFGKNIEKAVRDGVGLRQQLREMPIRDIRDVEAMARLDADVRQLLEVPELVADAFIAEVFSVGNNGYLLETLLASLAIQAEHAISGIEEALEGIISKAKIGLSKNLPCNKTLPLPFHWPIEFPEVFYTQPSGFDSIIGNPPFQGGKKISGSNGEAYREFLVTQLANSKRGNADLIAYFILRASGLIKRHGSIGLITTNSVAEGETRDVGLRQMLVGDYEIYHAVRSEPWVGSANVSTSRIHCYKGKWNGARLLDGKEVDFISASLNPLEGWAPVKLKKNEGRCFQGSIILGLGFTMEPKLALEIVAIHPDYKGSVLFPYLIGKELNSKSIPDADRWVINFWDWSEEDAKRYPSLYEQVRELVKPERDNLRDNASAKGYKRTWWLFGRDGKNLYHAAGRGALFHRHPKGEFSLRPLDKVLAFATQASKYPCFTFVSNDYVFANSLCVISTEKFSVFACLSSDIHGVWAFEHGSRLEDRLRYAHGDIFDTFPFPLGGLEGMDILENIGRIYFEKRQSYMLMHNKGMTKFYNDIHNDKLVNPEIEECRKLRIELSKQVLESYYFNDIDLNYGFHNVPYLPENDQVRFTISESARKEVLYRLTELNHERYEIEVNSGFHGIASARNKPSSLTQRHATHRDNSVQVGLDF